MDKKPFITSAFGLAKEKELVSDDFFEVKVIDDICIAVLCDGVGSALKGREAARRVVRYLINNFKNRPQSWSIEKSLNTFIKNINQILYRESIEEYQRTEFVTTLCITIIEGNRLYGANVGDSKIYLLRDDNLIELSDEHSLDEKGLEHVLTKAIGLEEDVEPYYFENNLDHLEWYLDLKDGENILSVDLENIQKINKYRQLRQIKIASLKHILEKNQIWYVYLDTSLDVFKSLLEFFLHRNYK